MNKRADLEPGLAPPTREGQSSSLQIEYTSTRVLPEAGRFLRACRGVVGSDRTPVADAYKVLRAQLLQRMRAENWNSIAVTSVRSSLAKSLASVNLALTFAAELDKTALLVDADPESSLTERYFGLNNLPGLSDHLLDELPIQSVVVNPGIEHLVLLPAGRRVVHSAELLSTQACAWLLGELKVRYAERYIVIDAPGILTAEGLSLFEKVDCVLVVAEQNVTRRADLEECAERLARFNVIGSILCEQLDPSGVPAGAPPQNASAAVRRR